MAFLINSFLILNFFSLLTEYFIQSIDLINKLFKDILKNEYANNYIDIKGENLKITRKKLIAFACKVWYDEYIIS